MRQGKTSEHSAELSERAVHSDQWRIKDEQKRLRLDETEGIMRIKYF